MDINKYNKQIKKRKKRKAIKNLKQYSHNTETSIEKKVREYLQAEGIFFKQEYPMKQTIKKKEHYKVYDFYVSGMTKKGNTFSFLIETDGFYYHAHKYLEGNQSYSKLTKLQKDNLKNDELKTKMANLVGLPLLRLKEKDIKYDFKKIKEQINEMINSFDSLI